MRLFCSLLLCAADALRFTERFIQRYRGDPLIVPAFAPQALFSSNTPFYNLYSQTGYALKGADVDNVMVNGRFIVRNRRMLVLNQKRVLAKAEEFAAKVRASLGYSLP